MLQSMLKYAGHCSGKIYKKPMQNIIPIISNKFPAAVIPLIEQSKTKISILVFDWRWYPQDIGSSIQLFNNAIIRKASQGVKIKAILRENTTARILKENNVKAKIKDFDRLIHTKLMLIDEEITIIGSHNYTKNAFEKNLECSILVFSKKLNKELSVYFENLWL